MMKRTLFIGQLSTLGVLVLIAFLGGACSPSSPSASARQTSRDVQPDGSQSDVEVSIVEIENTPPVSVMGEVASMDTESLPAIPAATPIDSEHNLLEQITLENGNELGQDYLGQGSSLLRTGKHDEALVALRRAAFVQPKSGRVWTLLGKTYLDGGDVERGIACLKESARVAPLDVEPRRILRQFYWGDGQFAEARVHAEVDGRLSPINFQSHYMLGRIYSNLSMWREAIGAYRKALTIDSNHVHANNNLGFAALQIGDDAVALEFLERATESTDVRPYMFNNLGIAYERLSQPASAHAAYVRALELKEGYVKATVNRDRLAKLLSDETHDQVEKADESDPTEPMQVAEVQAGGAESVSGSSDEGAATGVALVSQVTSSEP